MVKKSEPPRVAAVIGGSGAFKTMWSNKRMFSLAVNSNLPQLVSKPIKKNQSFRYEIRVNDLVIPVTHQVAKKFVDCISRIRRIRGGRP